jgi:hypothetical protein
MNFAETLCKYNTDMTFSYISGAGTDSTERGRINWARVKGKTENDLMKLPFKQVFAFRPGFLQTTKGATHVKSFYKWIKWVYPPMRFLFPKFACSLKELGLAMINSALYGYDNKILDVIDIVKLSAR